MSDKTAETTLKAIIGGRQEQPADLVKSPQPAGRAAPSELSKRAVPVWKRITSLLATDDLEETDLFLLVRYCELFAEWEELNKHRVKSRPYKERTSNKGQKYFVKDPKYSRLEQVEALLLRHEKELGLTRKARRAGRMKADPATTEDRAKLYRGSR